jgi:D-alanyl-D-alanine carboxypeptidase
MRILALPLAVLAFHGTIQPLPPPLRAELVSAGMWHKGCPVPLGQLRLLTVSYWGFDRRAHKGQLVVNAAVAAPLRTVFGRLFALRFRIRQMRPVNLNGDDTAAFQCRDAAPSPCPGTKANGHWSMHAYGEAIDVNPTENPYTGCGRTRDSAARAYLDRSRLRRGMVTPAVVGAFRFVGWGWGGAWSGTKDYMHFSVNGH